LRRAPALVLALVLGLAAAFAACSGGETRPAAPAPPFTLSDLDGHRVSLADFAGRTVLVDFWATWCEPCAHQIPVLNDFHRGQPADGVVVLGVSVDAGGRDAVATYAHEHRIEYPVLLGSESLARDYGVPGFPALAVVDAQGRLASLHLGVITPEELRGVVEQARN
jgi:cytochrome c biogenesis protein CcmG/thiol:disulfide interchange protein DsbE